MQAYLQYLGSVGTYISRIQVLSALGPTSATRLVVGLKALLAYEFILVDFLLLAMPTSIGRSHILFRANIGLVQCLNLPLTIQTLATIHNDSVS